MKKVSHVLIGALIFLTPSNLFLKFFENVAFVNGLLVDYLIPKIHLSDIILIVLLFATRFKFGKFALLPIVLYCLLLIVQLITPHPVVAILQLVKVGIFVALLHSLAPIGLDSRILKRALIVTLTFQSLVGLWQIITQTSLAGYWLLGEPELTSLGISSISIAGREFIPPYGTTAHPNILGGILAIFSVLLLKSSKSKKIHGFLALPMFVLLFTFSISAWLALLTGVVLLWIPYIYHTHEKKLLSIAAIIFIVTPVLISLVTTTTDHPSITRRAYLTQASMNMIIANPFKGVGLQQFTVQAEHFSPTREIVRFLQPVHHVGLLWISETGLLGLVLFLVVVWKLRFNPAALMLLPIAVLDHYLLTVQSGLLLGFITLLLLRERRH